MKKMPLIIAAVVTGVLLTAVGGAAAWYTLRRTATSRNVSN